MDINLMKASIKEFDALVEKFGAKKDKEVKESGKKGTGKKVSVDISVSDEELQKELKETMDRISKMFDGWFKELEKKDKELEKALKAINEEMKKDKENKKNPGKPEEPEKPQKPKQPKKPGKPKNPGTPKKPKEPEKPTVILKR